MTDATPFTLDRAENPHPKMRARARMLRQQARDGDPASTEFTAAFMLWRGYLLAMCDATGAGEAAMLIWLDTPQDGDA